MIPLVENKISTKNKIISSKIWYGNPQIELTEGNITYEKIIYTINSQNGNNNSSIISISDFTNQSDIFSDLNESELEFIKQYIWEQNIKNNLINSSELACINIPNKISINEFLASISIYLSYINTIRVLKSPIPNIYFIYLEMKNKEFSNIFFNTFNYSKINPIEKEYLIFGEVKEINFERGGDSFKTKRKSPKNQNYTSHVTQCQCQNLNLKNITNLNTCTLSPQNSNSMIIDISVSNSDQNEEIENIVCPICLEHIDEKSQTQNNFNQKNELNHLTSTTGIIHVLCGHIFHIECCLKLDDGKCPLCRYNLSPVNVSTCSLCTCENDLWMCLTCGNINCGEEGGSNNHRKEHYKNSGHIYAKALGHTQNVTYDFTKNSPLNLWFQNNVINNSNISGSVTDRLYSESDFIPTKDPKEKVEFIMSEYNSIISSQLESQRFYYLKLLRQIEESCRKEENLMDEEIMMLSKDLQEINEELDTCQKCKNSVLEELKVKDCNLKNLTEVLSNTEKEYKLLAMEKENLEKFEENIITEINLKCNQTDEEIQDLQGQLHELKIHLKTLEKTKGKEIAGSSIEFMTNNSSGSRRSNKKKK
jgi:BRCA1-associated protein